MSSRLRLTHGLDFIRLRYEALEERVLLSIRDIGARANIRLDDFVADSQYAGVRGTGYSVAIIDHGIEMNHPYFGSDNLINATGQPGSDGIRSDRIHLELYEHAARSYGYAYKPGARSARRQYCRGLQSQPIRGRRARRKNHWAAGVQR